MEEQENACDCGCSRREFITTSGTATLGMSALPFSSMLANEFKAPVMKNKTGASVKTVFLYPPSATFSDDPDGWWSWPGNQYDAEGKQKEYTERIKKIGSGLDMNIGINDKSVADDGDVQKITEELKSEKPDGLLLIMFYNRSRGHADTLIQAAEELGIPTIFYIGLGVMHGHWRSYNNRPGLYFIQSADNYEAIESGMRMINAGKRLGQSTLLSISDGEERKVTKEAFFGITVQPVQFSEYAEAFNSIALTSKADDFLNRLSRNAIELNNISKESLKNATRAYFALNSLIEKYQADAVTMNCLRRGMLKPCIAFSVLNNQLIPAVCENDLPAAYGQMIVQAVLGRPGFQHNPAYDTEKNNYYASHCTCATELNGPGGADTKYRLTNFAHTNEGSCAIQVYWEPDEPATMIHYYTGEKPRIDIYSGRIEEPSYDDSFVAGCTTRVELKITNRTTADQVVGHHNILCYGDFAKRFKDFALLHKIEIMDPVE
ncbi:MAG: hypothetical protein ABFS38_03955 [Bacteroidota bacterium]